MACKNWWIPSIFLVCTNRTLSSLPRQLSYEFHNFRTRIYPLSPGTFRRDMPYIRQRQRHCTFQDHKALLSRIRQHSMNLRELG